MHFRIIAADGGESQSNQRIERGRRKERRKAGVRNQMNLCSFHTFCSKRLVSAAGHHLCTSPLLDKENI